MSRIVKVKNSLVTGLTIAGATIAAGTYYTLTGSDLINWPSNSDVFAKVGDGTLVVNKGADVTDDIIDPVAAWKWLIGDTLPLSALGNKLAVHSSTKPELSDIATYSVWTGAGDDDTLSESLSLGGGELLNFSMAFDAGGAHDVIKDVKFDPRHGRIWIHEAYVKFENGGIPDYMGAAIFAPATVVQTSTNLDLVIANNFISYAPGGAGTGTHGWGGNPILIPVSYKLNGEWDYDGVNLTPNASTTGAYRIADIEHEVHRYFNKIPLNGTSSTYFTMTSDETAELVASSGYFVRITVRNESNSAWSASVIMEIYRERTTAL